MFHGKFVQICNVFPTFQSEYHDEENVGWNQTSIENLFSHKYIVAIGIDVILNCFLMLLLTIIC